MGELKETEYPPLKSQHNKKNPPRYGVETAVCKVPRVYRREVDLFTNLRTCSGGAGIFRRIF